METANILYIVICTSDASGETWAMNIACQSYDAAVEAVLEDMAESAGDFGEDERADARSLLEKEGCAEQGMCSYQIESVVVPAPAAPEPEPGGSFPVATLSRDDIEMSGYEPDALADSQLERIASKMGDAYVQNQYWDDLKYWLDEYGVPRLK